ncbi:TraR/DksA C4-type zinc finger protein [bacterium]|nr:TraR/DksA C4-type zinc finger protein [bacterium]
MRKTQIESFKKMLLAQKATLLEKVKNSVDMNKESSSDEVRDTADFASDYYERELAMGLSETERVRLQEVEDALERIDKGKYGKCEECGSQIAPQRLEALPFAKLCIECKAKEEKNGTSM